MRPVRCEGFIGLLGGDMTPLEEESQELAEGRHRHAPCDGAGRGCGCDARDGPAVVADRIGQEEAAAPRAVADGGDLDDSAAEVVSGEDGGSRSRCAIHRAR